MTDKQEDAGAPAWDAECDVLVAGSGAGALTGAYVAAARGLRTVVMEKTGLFGGTSAYSGAAIWLPGNAAERRADAGDSTDLAREYLTALLGEGARDRVEAFLETAPVVVDVLEADPHLEFEWSAFPDYFDAPGRLVRGRSIVPTPLPHERMGDLLSLVRPSVGLDRAGVPHPETTLLQGRALIGRLLLALRDTGNAELLTGTGLRELIVEADRVVGGVADVEGGLLRVRARRGVLLAAGGYERSAEFRSATVTPGRAEWTMSPSGTNSGEPLTAAVAIGAATDLLGEAWWAPGLVQPDGSPAFLLGLRGGFIIDATGRRFGNESLPYDQLGRMLAGNPSDGSDIGGTPRLPAYFVFDSRFEGTLPAISVPDASTEEYLDSGAWVRADSLDELGHKIGVPAAALKQTAEDFNEYARTGVDERFHRGEDAYDRFFGESTEGPNPCLVRVDRGPFHAARVVLSDLGTKGGVRTDADGRVLREDGSAIEGLYAAGNTSASMSGRKYPGPGIPIGTAMVFAFRAVQDMASNCR